MSMPAETNPSAEMRGTPQGRTMKDVAEAPTTLTSATLEDLTREFLVRLGEDPNREGLMKTPERIAKAYQYLTKGYDEDPAEVLHQQVSAVLGGRGAKWGAVQC